MRWIDLDDAAFPSAEPARPGTSVVSALAFDARGDFLAIGLPGLVAVYDVRDGTRVEEYPIPPRGGRTARVHSLQFSEDARRRLIELADTAHERTPQPVEVLLFDAGAGVPRVRHFVAAGTQPYQSARAHQAPGAALSADGRRLVVLDAARSELHVLDAETGAPLAPKVALSGAQPGRDRVPLRPKSIALCADGRWAAVAGDGGVDLWDLDARKCVPALRTQGGTWQTLDVAPDARSILAVCGGREVVVIDVRGRAARATRTILRAPGSYFAVHGSLVTQRVLWRLGSFGPKGWHLRVPDLVRHDLATNQCRVVGQSFDVAGRMRTLAACTAVSRDGSRIARAGDRGVLVTTLRRRLPHEPPDPRLTAHLPRLVAGALLYQHRLQIGPERGASVSSEAHRVVAVERDAVVVERRSVRRGGGSPTRVPRAPLERGQVVWWPPGRVLLTRDPDGVRWWEAAKAAFAPTACDFNRWAPRAPSSARP